MPKPFSPSDPWVDVEDADTDAWLGFVQWTHTRRAAGECSMSLHNGKLGGQRTDCVSKWYVKSDNWRDRWRWHKFLVFFFCAGVSTSAWLGDIWAMGIFLAFGQVFHCFIEHGKSKWKFSLKSVCFTLCVCWHYKVISAH